MTFQPVVPSGGLVGWRYVQNTLDRQLELFANSPNTKRDTDYFAEKIGGVSTAEELVSDRRLLRVALGAFGLQDDINNSAFIRKILEEGTENPRALANRLADSRYEALSRFFGFDEVGGTNTDSPEFANDLITRFQNTEFEVAVGIQNDQMRLGLNAMREIDALLKEESTEDTKWFTILGTPPLRSVFETAFGLPTGFGQIDIEQQVETLKDMLSRKLGFESLNDLSEGGNRGKLVDRFFLQSQVSELSQSASGASVALALLRSSQG